MTDGNHLVSFTANMADVTLLDGVTYMSGILGSLLVLIVVLSYAQKVKKSGVLQVPHSDNAAKKDYESYALVYTCIWIGVFAVVIVTKVYEQFDANAYMALCGSLSLPFLLQPILYPLETEKNLPLYLRYSFKANLWIAIFSFIGNYWYTHYFYSVLQAFYDFPSLRLNNVPICLFFATHFYFVTYHTFSNYLLRFIEQRYDSGTMRSILFWTVVFAFSYFTAFMETLTISSFEHYGFGVSRSLIYSLGSAFYGIYFIVSFPVFYRLDEEVNGNEGKQPYTIFQVIMEVMGSSMIVLCLLDACRLAMGVDLNIPGIALCQNEAGAQC